MPTNILNSNYSSIYNLNFKGEKLPKKIVSMKEVLILCSGNSIQRYKDYIEDFITKSKIKSLFKFSFNYLNVSFIILLYFKHFNSYSSLIFIISNYFYM